MRDTENSLLTLFKSIPDPRDPSGKRHLLEELLVISVMAVICGAEDWQSIEEYGKDNEDFLREFLELPHGPASDDTYRRLMIRLDSEVFGRLFTQWTYRLVEVVSGDFISIDGKTARHSFKDGVFSTALHVVSAWSNANHLVLGQLKAPKNKVNEAKIIPELLDMICLAGNVVTIDAAGTQVAIAEKIISREADYILAVKDNQPSLAEEIEPILRVMPPDSKDETFDGSHGRIDHRICEVSHRVDLLEAGLRWPGIQTLVKITSTRETKKKKTTEYRYYISSLKEDASFFNKAIREHWGIENSLHWVLDIAFREDECRKRTGNQAENFSIVRKFAFNLLKRDKSVKLGVKNKRLKAAWNRKYLIDLIATGE